ncbi:globin, partial [Oesophagostomum dentatum]
FFTHYPDVRKYFKGAENYAANDVAKSGRRVECGETLKRFDKQGNDILLTVHVLTETYENDNVFRGVCCDVINRHVEGERHLDPALWKEHKKTFTEAFFGVQKIALENALFFQVKIRYVQKLYVLIESSGQGQFCSIWVAWLESKGVTISADQKAAWDTLSVTFNEECQKYLAALGQPHL